MSGEPMRLCCPYCDGQVVPELSYTGWAYSEHRDCTGFECMDCSAEWEANGDVRREP